MVHVGYAIRKIVAETARSAREPYDEMLAAEGQAPRELSVCRSRWTTGAHRPPESGDRREADLLAD
jgi:hypothetical protein